MSRPAPQSENHPIGAHPARWTLAFLAVATVISLVVYTTGSPSAPNFDDEEIGQLTVALKSARQQYQHAHRRARQARVQVDTAQARLRSLLDDHFGAPVDVAQPPSKTPAASTPATAALRPSVNPHYRELAERSSALSRRRDELLLRMTGEHPAVQNIELQLADLKRQLAGTAELVVPAQIAPPAVEHLESPLRPVPGNHRQAAEAYAQAAQLLERAQSAADSASAEELQAIDRHLAAASDLTRALGELQGRQPQSDPRLWVVLAFAVGLALVVVGLAALGRQYATGRLLAASDVERVLGIPLVAVVPGVTVARASSGRKSGLGLMTDMVLAVAVFALVAWFVHDPSSITQLLGAR